MVASNVATSVYCYMDIMYVASNLLPELYIDTQILMNVNSTMEGVTMTVLTPMAVTTVLAIMGTF